MERVYFDAAQLGQLEKVRQVTLGTGHYTYVRRLPGSKLFDLEAAREADTSEKAFRLLALMLCDAGGKPTHAWSSDVYKSLKAWPPGFIAAALEAGCQLNGISEDDDPN